MSKIFRLEINNALEYTIDNDGNGVYRMYDYVVIATYRNDLLYEAGLRSSLFWLEHGCALMDIATKAEGIIYENFDPDKRLSFKVTEIDNPTDGEIKLAESTHEGLLEFETMGEHKPKLGIFKPRIAAIARKKFDIWYSDAENIEYLINKYLTPIELSNFCVFYK